VGKSLITAKKNTSLLRLIFHAEGQVYGNPRKLLNTWTVYLMNISNT